MPGHEYPIPWVPAQKNLLPVGIVPGTSRTEVRLTNHFASTSRRAIAVSLCAHQSPPPVAQVALAGGRQSRCGAGRSTLPRSKAVASTDMPDPQALFPSRTQQKNSLRGISGGHVYVCQHAGNGVWCICDVSNLLAL